MQLFSDDAVAERTVAFWKEVIEPHLGASNLKGK